MTFTAIPTQPFLATNDLSADLFPVLSELTVAQAAKIIGEPEGYIDELLKAGLVAFRQENGERLIQRDSFLEFEAEDREMGEALTEITRWSQEMGLYD